MYKRAVRSLVKTMIGRLNQGELEPLVRLAAPDAWLAFPGDNSWSRMFREPQPGRAMHATHRGRDELRALGQRFIDERLRIDVDDILVNGPPWKLRICVRGTDRAVDAAGAETYSNRIAALIDVRWGKILRWEDYLDTERIAAWDRSRALNASTPV